MTKDEARARLERHLGFAWDAGTKGGKDGINHGMKLADAYAQAYSDAALALADTLGMLEALADRDATGSIMLMVDKTINLIVQAHWSPYRYFSCAFEDNEGSRADAHALLAGEEKKE